MPESKAVVRCPRCRLTQYLKKTGQRCVRCRRELVTAPLLRMREVVEEAEATREEQKARARAVPIGVRIIARLKVVRLKAGISQDKLAKMMNWPRTYVSKLETSKKGSSYMTLAKIAAALELPMTILLDERIAAADLWMWRGAIDEPTAGIAEMRLPETAREEVVRMARDLSRKQLRFSEYQEVA